MPHAYYVDFLFFLGYYIYAMLKSFKKLKIHVNLKSLIYLGVLIALILVDLLTKIYEERNGWNFKIIPGFIEVHSGSRNPGCAFSFLAEADWGQPFLIATTFLLLIVLIGGFLLLPNRFIILKASITMITGGAIGNLIDRIAYFEVRDFVEINMFGNMTSCNFADFWIVLGTVLAIVDLLFINEWALIPLTKSARAAQKAKEEKKSEDNSESVPPQDEPKE